MHKTKVKISPSLLDYRQGMAELVNEVCEENEFANRDRPDVTEFGSAATEVAELWVPGLLRPPKIELLYPDLWVNDGHLDGIIHINTSEYFGVLNVYVVLEDDQGHRLESDYAIDTDDVENSWGYFPSVPLPAGSTVIVRAVASDALGGLSIAEEKVMLTEEYLQQTTDQLE